MSTIADLERVERELRTFAPPLLGESWERRELRLADTIAAYIAAQRARELPDTDLGPWRADGKFIYSANFDHDAMLTVSGDFNSESVRDDFAAKVADRLNAPPTDTIAAYIAAQRAWLRQPSHYAYRYADGYIRFSGGARVNGQDPIESIALYALPEPPKENTNG